MYSYYNPHTRGRDIARKASFRILLILRHILYICYILFPLFIDNVGSVLRKRVRLAATVLYFILGAVGNICIQSWMVLPRLEVLGGGW